MMLLFCTAVSVGNSVAQTYQKGYAGDPFHYTRASLTERVKVVMIGASSIQPNTGVGCAGADEPNNDYKNKVSYTTKTGGFTTNSAQSYSSADVTQSYFADYPGSCPRIKHAYLYWGGSAYADNVDANYWNERVYITRPNGTESGAISAQYYGSTEGFESERTGGSAASDDCMSYWAMADVTSVLAGQGIGTIGVRGVKADINDSKGGAIAGWCLVLLYEDGTSDSYPETQFTLFDGAAFFKEGSSVNKTLTFNAVTSGIISGSVGMAAMDGDVGSKTDQVTFTANGGATAQNLNDLRGTTDFFSSSMSYNGESMLHSENAAFGCGNTLGFDAHHIDLPKNSVTNSSNSATLKVSTNDTYMMPFMAYVAISSDVPSLVVSKVPSSSSVAPGQNLKYFIALKNEGGKQTQNNTAYVEDVLDYNVTYVPNSVRITLSSNAAITDQAWANATYNAGTRTLRVSNLPSIPSDATLTITYQVQVAGADRGDIWRSSCMREIWNMAEATYFDQDKPGIAKKAKSGTVTLCSNETSYNIIPVQADFETDYDMSAITHNVTEANNSVGLVAYLKSVLSAEIKNDTRSVANSEGLPVFSYYESNGTTPVSGNLNIATGQTKTYYAKRTLTTHPYKPACTEDVIEINLVRKECKLTAATFTATDVTCPGLTNGQIALTEIATAQDMAEGAKFDLISGLKNDPLAVTAADIISTHKTTTETGYTFGDLAAGDYSIMFTDGLGCKIIRNGTVKEPDPIEVTLNDPAACVGNRLEFVATTTGGMTGTDYYYKWYRSADGTNYTEDTTQGDDNTYSVNSTGTRVYVKAEAYSTLAECSFSVCKGEGTKMVTLSKAPKLTMDDKPTCEGSSVTLEATDSESATIASYSWEKSTDDGATWTAMSETTKSISVSPSVTTMYRTTWTTAGGCFDVATATVTVSPKPSVADKTYTICSGTPFTFAPEAGDNVPDGTVYTWSVTQTTGVTGASACTNVDALSQTLSNSTAADGTATYTVTPSLPGGCDGDPFTVTVTVKPIPYLTDKTYTICSGTAFTLEPKTGDIVPTGTKYSWTVENNANVTGWSAHGTPMATMSQILTNASEVQQVVNYTVTPTYSITTPALTCTGDPFAVAVTVNAVPTVDYAVPTGDVCPGSTVTLIATAAHGVEPYTYTWTGATAHTGDRSQADVTASTNCTGTVNVSLKVTDAAGCESLPVAKVVTTKDETAPVISGTIAAQAPVATGTACVFNYPDVRELVRAISTDACTANADLTVTQSPEQGTPIADVTVENTITVTVKDACNKSETYDVTVSSIAPLTFSPTDPAAVCAPNTVDLATAYTAETGFTYTYHSDAAGTVAIASPVVSASNTYYIKKTQTATGCFIVKPVTVTIKEKPTVTVTPAAAVCATEPVDLTATVSTTAANPSWTYFTDAAGTTPASVTTITWDATAPNQTADQTTTIYAVATSNGCVSDPTATTATLKHKPAAPGVEGINACPATTSTVRTWASLVTTTEGGATLTWYDGATVVTPADFDLSVAQSKTYSVTQTVNGCESEKATVSVVISNTPTDPDVADLVQCVQASGTPVAWSTLVNTAGTQTWYETSASATPFTPSDIDVTAASTVTYYVTVTDGSGCISNKVPVTATIKANPTLTNIVATPVKCKGNNNGAISVTSNGTSFAWTKGGAADASLTGASISGLEPATYTVTATLDGCTTTSNNIVVTEPDALTLTQTSLTPAACYGGEGSVTVEAQGGNGTYQYTWNDPESKTGATVSLKKGDYIVTVEDAKGCTKTLDVSMTQPDQVTAEAGDAISAGPICSDETTTVTLGATAPAAGLTGAWTTVSAPAGVTPVFADAASATSSVSGLKPGEYTLRWTVTRAPGGEGCEAYDDVVVTITEDTEKPTFALSATTAAATAAGNCVFKVPDLSGLVSNKSDNYSAAADITISQNQVAGTTITAATTVEITVTDKCGNVSDAQTVTVNVPAAVVATVTGTETALCYGSETGSISVDVSGGTSPYTYAWTKDGAGIAAATEDLTGVGAGDYVLTVTDADGCTTTAPATVDQATQITGSATPTETSSPIATDGKVTVTSTAGGYTGAGVTYQFALKQGGAIVAAYQSGTEFTGLAAGTYEVWAKNYKDALTTFDCEYKIDEVTIIAPSNIESTITQVPVKCYGEGTGSVVVTVTDGGTAPYRLQLEKTDGTVVVAYDVATAVAKNVAKTFANLPAGPYVVKVMDTSDYEATLGSITVAQPTEALSAEIKATDIVNVKCHGGNTGSLTVTAKGGTTDYTYSWTGSTSVAAQAPDLTAGDYTVTVTDANNCSTTANATVTEPEAISISSLVPTEISCNGGNDGTITPTVSGGVAPYAYSWKDASAAEVSTSEVASGLAAGDYTLTVTDANNCPMTSSAVTVPEASVITGTPTGTNLTTPISVDGKVTVTSTAGGYTGAGYVYELRQGATVVAAYQSGTEFTGLAAGTYQVWVKNTKDAMTFNCEYNLGDVILSAPSAIQGNIAQTAVKCFGDNTGKITASVTNGGTAPYRLQLMKSDNTVVEDYGTAIAAGVDYVFENLSAGAYKINVKDASDYEATLGSMTVTQPTAALSAEIKATDIVNVKCHGGNTGSLTVTVTGGTTDYTYSWTGSTSVAAQAPDLTAGDYTVTVTDANNCTATANATVTEPAALTIGNKAYTICSGEPFTMETGGTDVVLANTKYTWTVAANDNVTGKSPEGTATETMSQTLTNTSADVQTVVYTVSPEADGCHGADFTVTVTVNPKPAIADKPYTICTGEAVPFATVAADIVPANTKYSWTIATDNANVSGQSTGTAQDAFAQTLTNATATAQTVVYTVTPKSGDCVGDNFTVTVTVNPKATIAAQTYTICTGDAVPFATKTGDVVPTGTKYTWVIATDNDKVGGKSAETTAQDAFAQTLTNATATAQTLTYTVTPMSGTCQGDDFTVEVTVNPKATIGNKTYTICTGEPFTLDVAGDVVPANTEYTWTVAANDKVTGKSDQTAGVASMSQTLTNATATAQTVVYTVTPKSGDCVGDDFTVEVTVNPKPAIANKDYTICTGNPFTLATVAADVVPTNTKYTWTVAANANVTGWSEQTTAADAMSQTLVNGTDVPQEVVYTVTPAGDCTGAPFTVTVTVNPMPAIGNKTYTICSGDQFTYATEAGDVVPTGIKYTWTVVDDANIEGESAQNTATETMSQTLTNKTNAPIDVVYTVTPAGTCPGAAFTVTVTVNPKAKINNKSYTIRTGEAFTLVTENPDVVPANTEYTWTVAPNANVSGQSAQGTGVASMSQTLTNATATAQTVVYTVTPKSGDCVGDNFTVTVTVKPKPAIANKTYTICSDDKFTYAPVASDVVPAGTTYTWTVGDNTDVDGDLPQTSASTTMSQTLINNSATAQTVTYTVTPVADGSVGDNFTVTVTVNPKAKIANKAYTRCTGESFTLDVTGDRVPTGTTYIWTVAANANVSGQSAQATGVASMTQTLTNATATAQNVVYTVTPKSGDCVGDDFTVTVTVNPKAKIANKTYTICSETAFTYAPVASDVVPAGTTYSWTKPVNANVEGQTEVIDATSMSQTLTNSTNTAQKVVYTVTPKSGSCEGDNFTVTVTVNPKPVITVNPAADVCNNLTVDLAATFSSNVSGSTFAYYTDAAGTSPASVTTAKWNASAPNQAVDQTTTLYAIATANGCPSEIASSSVTIKHKPVAPTVENIRECAAVTPEAREWASLVSNVEANAELKWYNGSAVVTPADFDMSVAMNKAYSVTQTVNGCESDKSMVEVHIKPLPEAPMVTNNVVCEGVGSKAWRDLVTSRVDGGVKTWFSDINGTAQIAEPITISFSKPGERTAYVAIEKDGCLSEIVEVSSSVHETPSFAEVIDESDESTTLRVNGVAPFTYLLDKNIREQFDGEVNLGILSIGNHPLTVSDEIGCKRDTVLRIEPIPLVPDKFFTPNGDGVNDKWTIKGLERYPETKIFLHDRYGKELAEFKAKDFDGWDGKYNGEDMPSTDYWYIIELRETGKRMVGHFLLRR